MVLNYVSVAVLVLVSAASAIGPGPAPDPSSETPAGTEGAASPTPAQFAEAVADYAPDVERILGEALEHGRAYVELSDLCRTAPRRLGGSPAFAAAVEWARQAMLRNGLENVRLEPCTSSHWVRGDVGRVRYAEPAEMAGDDVPMLALGGSVATPDEGITAEVVVVDSLEACSALGERAAGKIVLFVGPMDDGSLDPFAAYGAAVQQRGRGASTAARVGAVAALVRSMSMRRDDVPHTGGMHYAPDAPKIPTAAISTNAADRIAALVAAGRRVVLNLRQNPQTFEDAPAFNVVGELVGREHPEQIVVVGGHLDSWDVGQGAQDDGGGCCQAMESVRLLKALDLRPRRTIRVVFFANEENGLGGGRGYRATHADEMDRHLLALESDSGVFAPRGFETNATRDSNPAARALLEAVGELLAPAGAGLVRDGEGGADIGPMEDAGVIQVGYLPDPSRYFDYHHTERDTIDSVHPREIDLGAGVIASLLYVVADLPLTVPRGEVTESR
ncbi:MAG: M20/M25/M40 family metallo-hydrolase [Planctomycetes bacterium]|nr:M20/M25/M40 family metallo-hydrolase [Planctomycetota bacterium]